MFWKILLMLNAANVVYWAVKGDYFYVMIGAIGAGFSWWSMEDD
jgi:hypothetical protein